MSSRTQAPPQQSPSNPVTILMLGLIGLGLAAACNPAAHDKSAKVNDAESGTPKAEASVLLSAAYQG